MNNEKRSWIVTSLGFLANIARNDRDAECLLRYIQAVFECGDEREFLVALRKMTQFRFDCCERLTLPPEVFDAARFERGLA